MTARLPQAAYGLNRDHRDDRRIPPCIGTVPKRDAPESIRDKRAG